MADGLHARPEGLLPASPPRRSLLDVPGVRVTGALLATDWLHGIAVEPEGCSMLLPGDTDDLDADTTDYPYWWESCSDAGSRPTELQPGTKAIGVGAENIVAEPYTIWRGFRCSMSDLHAQARQDEVAARLRRLLEACTPAAVEHELWTGQVATLAGYDTPFLQELEAGAELYGGTPLGYVTALAELEQRLAECYCSGAHIIHAQPRTVAAWASENLLRVSPGGDYLETVATGAYVVAGSGYPGEDPNASAGIGSGLSYAYGTGMVRVFLGTPNIAPFDSGSVQTGATLVNTASVRIERDALAVFDRCCFTGVAVSLADRLAGAGS